MRGFFRSLAAVRTKEAPVIEGCLNESVLERAAVAERFWVSDQSRAPTEPSECPTNRTR